MGRPARKLTLFGKRSRLQPSRGEGAREEGEGVTSSEEEIELVSLFGVPYGKSAKSETRMKADAAPRSTRSRFERRRARGVQENFRRTGADKKLAAGSPDSCRRRWTRK